MKNRYFPNNGNENFRTIKLQNQAVKLSALTRNLPILLLRLQSTDRIKSNKRIQQTQKLFLPLKIVQLGNFKILQPFFGKCLSENEETNRRRILIGLPVSDKSHKKRKTFGVPESLSIFILFVVFVVPTEEKKKKELLNADCFADFRIDVHFSFQSLLHFLSIFIFSSFWEIFRYNFFENNYFCKYFDEAGHKHYLT